MSALPLADLYERVKQSELGSLWADDPLMQQDVWPLTALGFNEEQCRVHGGKNVHFTRITLPWLKYLAKLTAKARVREKCSASRIIVISNKFATCAFTCKPCPGRGYSDDQCLKVLHFPVKRLYY